MKNLSLLIIGIIVLFSCKREKIPIQEEGKIIFQMSGQINDSDFKWEAGKNNRYMYAETGYQLPLTYYSGKWGPQNCDGACPTSFEIRFFNHTETFKNTPTSIESTLLPGNKEWNFWNDNSLNALFYVIPDPTLKLESAKWLVDDTGGNRSFFRHQFTTDGLQPFQVDIKYTNGCEVNLPGAIEVQRTNRDDCTPLISRTVENDGSITFENIGNHVSDGAIWESGGTLISNNNSINTILEPNQSKIICFTSLNNGCNSKWCTIISDGKCNIDAAYTFTAPLNNSISLIYHDENGERFTTENAAQDYQFEIINIQDYKSTELGKSTKKISIKFQALLFNESKNKTIQMDNVEGVIAVAY